jgi:hypothetical protein
MVPQHHWPSLACLHNGDNGSGAVDGAWALSAILAHLINVYNGGILFELQEVLASKYM